MRQLSWPRLKLSNHKIASTIFICEPCQKTNAGSHVWSRGLATSRKPRPSREQGQPMFVGDTSSERKRSLVHEFDRLPEWPKLPPGIIERRVNTVSRVQDAVQDAFGREYKVKPFGSTCYGADTVDSDIDLVIMDPRRPKGSAPESQKPTRIYNVRQLGKVLSKAGFKVHSVIPSAAVPIVKFLDRHTNLACDVNVNERLGYRNTQLIKRYCMILPLLPYVILATKHWAAGHRWSSNINSYTLAIMSIGVFQTRGILPNLQKAPLDGLPEDTLSVYYANVKGKRGAKKGSRGSKGSPEAQRCDTRFNVKEPNWLPRFFVSSLDDALYIWYRYWGYEHPYHECLIDIRRGGLVRRRKKWSSLPESPEPRLVSLEGEDAVLAMLNEAEQEDAEAAEFPSPEEFDAPLATTEQDEPTGWVRQPLVVRDPFLRSKNCGAQMKDFAVALFQNDCRKAADALEVKLKTHPSFAVLKGLPAITVVSPP
ncbi:uncharacterized protein PHACADRAFT_185987 [Phanerochaete carnosa HHB-10118-sp]|uniref:Poly(A) RNA polymerase mitochondrial-like central palm domain-containing protein n=1 Tax=Phanerochaete carnosa (strain HHB-10118-sp) TaxID=650164 RepID=K5WSE3_PHACS|nr:uncharacterized protein PHACADRAFT_185987 [Phanerochaete carnosa HHB-10118-sp]EKM53292.1 hypothetical protein PHACADRAFT_185987 [Phanerochaete carnosa HHB-10118-sp]